MMKVKGTPYTIASGQVYKFSKGWHPIAVDHGNCWAIKFVKTGQDYSGRCMGYYPTQAEAEDVCLMIQDRMDSGVEFFALPASWAGNVWEKPRRLCMRIFSASALDELSEEEIRDIIEEMDRRFKTRNAMEKLDKALRSEKTNENLAHYMQTHYDEKTLFRRLKEAFSK